MKSALSATVTGLQAKEMESFVEIAQLIASSRERVIQFINTGIIDLYWTIGERISQKIAAAEWGDGVVDQLATYLARSQPGIRGFTRANLFRMRRGSSATRFWSVVFDFGSGREM